MAEPAARGTLLPVSALGAASAVAAAVVGHHPWAHATGQTAGATTTLTSAAEAGRVPGCTALALVLLACWGVVLVTRGRVRRAVAWLGLLAASATVVAAGLGLASAPGQVRRAYAEFGVDDVPVTRTAWAYLAVPVVLLALAGAVVAVRVVRTWPEMGRRYDAPGAGPATPVVALGEEQDDVVVWKAISEGRDPTA